MTPAPYDKIANEYYSNTHKTCRNFDQATTEAIAEYRNIVPSDGLILDIGSGRGRCIEYLQVEAKRLIQLDSSREMLTINPREKCLLRVKHKAENLPFMDNEFSCVTSFLCDPFIGLNFLSETYRVLKPGGLFLATTPSYEWGIALRTTLDINPSTTRFITNKNETVEVPSTLISKAQITEMIKHVGFSSDILLKSLRLPVSTDVISDDITKAANALNCDAKSIDILYMILAWKSR